MYDIRMSSRSRQEPTITGRGAAFNPGNRFEKLKLEVHFDPTDDHLEHQEQHRPHTTFLTDASRSILSRNDSPDIPFRYGLSPYRGCEHGCSYCFARPYHEYLGFSSGLDFETKIVIKPDAPELLRQALSAKRWEPQPITMSAITDVYQPIERKLKLTRRCLEVFADFRNPVVIITKNHLITRDLDVLRELARFGCISVAVSLTTLDDDLRVKLEPRTSSPTRRLAAIEALASAGVPVGTMLAPIIPGLTDHEIPALLKAARNAGAGWAAYSVVRLPHAVEDIFTDWLERHRPERKDKVLNRIRGIRGGELSSTQFGTRMRGQGEFAQSIRALFKAAYRQAGFTPSDHALSTAHFRVPRDQDGLFD
jgi:DNA repair photolyase